jgi:2-methylcitrate dehydratase PrpD
VLSLSDADERSATARHRIADFICDFGVDAVDPTVLEKAKDHIVHLLASAFAGFFTTKGTQGREICQRLSGAGPCTVFGDPATATPAEAAFANSAMMTGGGLDDVLLPAGVHPGLVVLPAVLAVAEEERRSGADVLAAMVLGYEVLGKLAGLLWCWEARTPQRATIPFGAFGPTVAAAKLLQLSPLQTANAIGYAANSAMGLSENPFYDHAYALTARNGVTAATIAQCGGTTPPTTLEGSSGFFQSIFGMVPDLDDMISRLGDDLELARAQLKHYPTTGMNTTAIQLMLDMCATHRLTPDNVSEITLRISKRRENHRIGHANGALSSGWEACSSAPFNLALALVDQAVDPARYDDYDDPVLSAVRSKTSVVLENRDDLQYARLDITTTSGEHYSREAKDYTFPREPRLPKLRRDGDRLLGEDRVARLDQLISNLERVEDITELTAYLRPVHV